WWQASKHDSAERIQQLAEQTLIEQLLQNKVEAKLKLQFIAQCNRSSILEQLAQTETDAGIKFGLLQRLNKTELNLKALQDPVLQPAQKQQLLAQIDEEKALEKLSKQLSGDMLVQVQQKLALLNEQKQKPLLLRKQLTLMLSKLNAARDRSSVEALPALLADYQTQWQQLEGELHYLGDEAAEFRAKYQKITSQIEQWLAPRLEELSKLQAEQALREARAERTMALQQQFNQLEQALQQALLTTDISAAQQLEQQITTLSDALTNADITDKAGLTKRLTQLQQQLSRLPELAEQLTRLTRIVADWAAQP